MSNKITTPVIASDLAGAYVNWSDKPGSFEKASASLNAALDASRPLYRTGGRSTAALANRFQNIDTNVSVREGYSSLDYDFFRPNEQVPRLFRDVIAACMGAYQKVPIIKQIIDLMGDFAAQGIRLVHPNESVERFYNEWFRQVCGAERTERILNVFYRTGNVIVKRADAKLSQKDSEQWKKAVGEADLEHWTEDVSPYEVPYRYTILNPLVLQVLGEQIAAFTGNVHYVLELPMNFYNGLTMTGISFDQNILTEGLPQDLKTVFQNKERYLLLDSDKLITMFYKKDDWDIWAYPMIYSLLDEIILLQKMKQAEKAALDGIISHIRVWKLGDMENKIFPTDAAITKLSNILLNNIGGGAMDLVWGPDLELTQTSTDIAGILGSEKYEFVMNTIHSGLGVPAAIGRNKGTMSDNFMSIRVLIERLKYGRDCCTRFWDWEIRRVQRAMGFRYPARVMYDHMSLQDEVAEKALWIQLADREIIPIEAVQERFGRIPEIDNILLMREKKKRDAGKMTPKVSPYHDSQPELSMKKIALQRGTMGPEQVGLAVPPPSPTEKKHQESEFPKPPPPGSTTTKKKPTGKSGQGRPRGATDKKKRKTRTPKPSSKAEIFLLNSLHANKLQKVIGEVVNPFFLDKFAKKTLRSLTAEEGIELEKFKFTLLFSCDEELPANVSTVMAALNTELQVYDGIDEVYLQLSQELRTNKGEDLTAEEMNNVKSYIYALTRAETDEDDDEEENN